jgi:hypothetical protein
MVTGRHILPLVVSLLVGVHGHAAESPETAQARKLWAQSPHGRMLERILPPAVEPQQLPEPHADGARLMTRYCVQCHHLPSPQMHAATRWQSVVERMVWRMRGQGNMGALMKDMMASVAAPSDPEVAALAAYLRKHAQREIDPKHPALQTGAGQMYSLACSQCHALPDPQRHTAGEWPGVVKRMQAHMAWATTIVGVRELRTNPELDTAEIVRLLQRHARRDGNR